MLRPLVLLMTVVTGTTGLVYEVVWQKYFATLLGSHSEATAAVLGLFLAGLSIGYRVFGEVARRAAARASAAGRQLRLLPLYGGVEAGIGVYALLYPWLFAGVQRVSLLGPLGSGAAGFAFDIGLTAVLILPPTVLMGGTIPLLTQGLSRNLDDATRFHALVYGFNTAGAFIGALCGAFVLVPWLGLDGVMIAMGCTNIAAGLVLGLLGRRVEAAAPLQPPDRGVRPEGFAGYVAIAFLTGFGMMVTQTVLNRVGALALGSSPFTFSMVAALFVFCIAIGSLLVSLLSAVPSRLLLINQAFLLMWLVSLDDFLPSAGFWAHVLRTSYSQTNIAFYAYYAATFLGMLLVVGPAVVASGATLPLLFHHLKRAAGELGATAGSLYAWNTIGSLLGALLGGYLLFFWIDLDDVFRVAVVSLVLSVAILAPRVLVVPRWGAALAALAVATLVLARPGWDPALLNAGLFRRPQPLPVDPYTAVEVARLAGGEVLAATDDPVASVSVHAETLADGTYVRAVYSNGKSESSTGGDAPTTGLMALIPALVVEQLKAAFVIGWGTGITPGELALLDSIETVVVAEISPGMLEMDPWFADWNHGAGSNPKIEVVRGDAYRALRRGGARYDAIVSAPSNPWVAGVEMLYSVEFLEAARERLQPGGVYVQWIQQYDSDARALELVLRTFGQVFPTVAVWGAASGDYLLLGFPEAGRSIDLDRLQVRAARPDVAAGLVRAGVHSLPALLAHELWPTGVLHALELEGPVHRLLRPRLNHVAVRAFFRGQFAALPFAGFGPAEEVGHRNSLVQRWRRRPAPAEAAETAALVAHACQTQRRLCASLLADWLVAEPDSQAARRELDGLALPRDWVGEPLPTRDVLDLAALGAGSFGADEPIDPARAARATQVYYELHTHAARLRSQRLLQTWHRCRATPAQAADCERGLEESLQLFSR